MNYQKIYDQIIKQAKTRKLDGYKEKHHIIPKCIGGLDTKENLVELTAREHFICHRLLCEIYPDNLKLKYALVLMNIGKQKHKDADYQISSRVYSILKEEHSLLMKGNKNCVGMKHSEETKKKIGEKNKHNKPEGFGKKHDGYRDIIKETWTVGDRRENHSNKMKQSWENRTRKITQLDKENNIIKE